jgi:Dolichyl-phosphate-mannose-protein mannosyltransferase
MHVRTKASTAPGTFAEADPSAALHRAIWIAGAGALLAVVDLALRYRLALTPALAETYYDEALTGLMAFEILRGVPQVFYWGEPYGGAIGDAYPAAVGFWLFGPSTLVLRMASAVIAVLWAWSVWFIARRAGAGPFAFLAGLLVAVPPVFLSYAQLSTHGESSALAFAALAVASAAYLIDPRPTRARAAAWAILGLASGVSWWSSQIGAMVLLAAALVLVVARPGILRGPGPYVACALFLVASLPFWVWNVRHDWATLRHLAMWGGPLPPWSMRWQVVTATLVKSLRHYFWDGRAVSLPSWAQALGWIAVWGVYGPAGLVAVARGFVWGQRVRRWERPWQDALDLVAVAFWMTVAAHLLTWFGTSTVLRYEMTFHVTLPVLCALALGRLAAAGWAPVAGALAAALLAFNVATHVAFVRDSRSAPRRPVDAAIARLEALGIRGCYADSRIAQVVTFESRERVLCADYLGLRNYAALRAVDGLEDPTAVAVVTHRGRGLRARRRTVSAGRRRRLRDLPSLRDARTDQADPGGRVGGTGVDWRPGHGAARVRPTGVDALDGPPGARAVVRGRPGTTLPRRADHARHRAMGGRSAPWPPHGDFTRRPYLEDGGLGQGGVGRTPLVERPSPRRRQREGGRPDGVSLDALPAPRPDGAGGDAEVLGNRGAVRPRSSRGAVEATLGRPRSGGHRRGPAGALDGRPHRAQSDPSTRHVRAPAGAGALEHGL